VLPPLPGTVFPSCLCNSEGLIAVRVSPHPIPTLLSKASGMFLTASSANLRGNPPVTNPSDLDPALLSRLASLHYPIGLLPHEQGFAPLGYKPSTILKPCSASYPSQTTVDVLRLGAFSLDDLKKTGLSFSLEKKELF
ncbi:MAG: Sua5/YciO/YrdC/YwlC family protein, partial [Desulfovibrio sp.]|nr:Sua5/YciO/YrdC/YwlC family protein [Desulfovibrio sp.]